MALENSVSNSPESAGRELASRINDAVNRNDSKLYNETMSGINEWTKSHDSSLTGKFEESLIGTVDLKTAALYETRENFSRIDTNNDKRVKPDELRDYANQADTNALQKAMIDKEILPQYESIANNSRDRIGSSFFRDSHIRSADLDKGLETAAANRPTPQLTDKEVAEKVQSPEFVADSEQYAIDKFEQIDTNKNEKLDKAELQNFAGQPNRSLLEKAYINDGVLPRYEDIANTNVDNFWGFAGKRDTEIRRGDLQQSLKNEYAKPEVQAALAESRQPELTPTDKIMELATVRRGEGPFHSAERLLSAAGGKHNIDEVRAVTKALKSMYDAEGHGDLKDLRVKHNFITRENFNKLINSIDNESAREALKKLAAA